MSYLFVGSDVTDRLPAFLLSAYSAWNSSIKTVSTKHSDFWTLTPSSAGYTLSLHLLTVALTHCLDRPLFAKRRNLIQTGAITM